MISLVDSDSFWIDGYFRESQLHAIREGDEARVKLMGYPELVRGHAEPDRRAAVQHVRVDHDSQRQLLQVLELRHHERLRVM